MPITVREKSEPKSMCTDNPDGITYRMFDCPMCGYTIAFRLKAIHVCRSCDTTVIDIFRLLTNSRYRLCYHRGVINDKGHWDWTKYDGICY